MKETMTLIDASGKEIVCEIVAIFRDGEKNYIAYTDLTDASEEKDLLVSKFVKDGENIRLIEITLEDEWKFVEKYLDEEVFGGEDDDSL